MFTQSEIDFEAARLELMAEHPHYMPAVAQEPKDLPFIGERKVEFNKDAWRLIDGVVLN